MQEAVIVSAVRIPTGKFLGTLKDLSATDLGALAVREAVARAGIDPASVDECIMGNVVSAGTGQAPARQAGGAAIARATTVALADGVLAVTCLDPQWAREVHRIRHELLRQLGRWLGPDVVTRIDVAGGAEIRGRRRRRPATITSGA